MTQMKIFIKLPNLKNPFLQNPKIDVLSNLLRSKDWLLERAIMWLKECMNKK